ncbi:MAG: membrane protein insertase YidC [Magnetococcales bacterium]|nr:membrane protein insertase YidC [Magnetococcales bacterium]
MDRRLLLAISLSFALLLAYQVFMGIYFPPAPPRAENPATTSQTQTPAQPATAPAAPEVTKSPSTSPGTISAPASGQITPSGGGETFSFGNELLSGSVSQEGARLVKTRFLRFHESIEAESHPVAFLNDAGAEPFVGETGYLAQDGIKVPGRTTRWESVSDSSTPSGRILHLRWDNGQGQVFEKILSLEAKSYLLTVTDRVSNQGAAPAPLFHYAQFLRVQPKGDANKQFYDFQGPMGFLNGTRIQHEYADVIAKEPPVDKSAEGWVGFSDRYFLAALVPGDAVTSKRFYFDYDAPSHRVGVVSPKLDVAAGGKQENVTRLFIGPKEIRTLESLNLHLERSIDYGWFHFLAVPLVDLMLFFNDFLGNYGLAIILLTFVIKLLFYPLANKSYRSMSAMKKLQPRMEELKRLYGDDKQRMNQEMMRLYQEEKVNPLGGCLPIIIQIPVFFALYKVLYLSVEMRHAPFFLWIHDLTAMDPFYVLPLLMGVSMFIQTKLNPTPADPVQAKVMLFLPVIFTVMFLTFPSGLVLYWLVNNVLSIIQQSYIMKQTT